MDREGSRVAGDSAQDRSNAGYRSHEKSKISAIQPRNGESFPTNHADMSWRGKGKYDTSPKGAFAKGKYGNYNSKGCHSKPSDDMGAWRSYELDDEYHYGSRSQHSQPVKGGKATSSMSEDIRWSEKGKHDTYSKGEFAKGKPAGSSYKGGSPPSRHDYSSWRDQEVVPQNSYSVHSQFARGGGEMYASGPDQKGWARDGEHANFGKGISSKGKAADFPVDRPARYPDQFDGRPPEGEFSDSRFAKGGGYNSSSHNADWLGKGGKHESSYKGDLGKEFGKGKHNAAPEAPGKGKQIDFIHGSAAHVKGESGKEFGKGKHNAALEAPGKGKQVDFVRDSAAHVKGDFGNDFRKGNHNVAPEAPGKGKQVDFIHYSAAHVKGSFGKDFGKGNHSFVPEPPGRGKQFDSMNNFVGRGNYVNSAMGQDAHNGCKGSSILPWDAKLGHGDQNFQANEGHGFFEKSSQAKGRSDGFMMNDKGKNDFRQYPDRLGKGIPADGLASQFKGDNFQKGHSNPSKGGPVHVPPRFMESGGDGNLHRQDFSKGKTIGFPCGGCKGSREEMFNRDLDRDQPPNNGQPAGGNITFGELMEVGRTLDATGSQPKPLSVPSIPIAPQLMSTRPPDAPPPVPGAPPMPTRPQEMTGTPWIPQSSSIWNQSMPGTTAPPEIAGLWETPTHAMPMPPRPPSPAHSNASGIRTPSDDGFAMPRSCAAVSIANTPTPMAADYSWQAHQQLQESPYDAVHRAQQTAMVYQQMAPISIEQISDFVGAWVDLQGNSVTVFSTDAWGGTSSLLVTISKAPRPDVHLQLSPSEDGGWRCGNSYLDMANSSFDQLSWVREDGLVSVWTRGRR